MNLKDGMLLYHGSYTPVERIDLGMCSDAKDFGKGFYLTSDLCRPEVLSNRRFSRLSGMGQ